MTRMNLHAESGRPVATAIEILRARHGWVITYEDPLYVNDSDIRDVTESVSRHLDEYRPGEGPRVLVPKGGVLEISYIVRADTNQPTDREAVLNELLNAQAESTNGGRFRLEMNGEIAHVIPIAYRNRKGELVPQESPLDAIISLRAEERTGVQKLLSICNAASQGANTRVVLGVFPLNLFMRHRDREGAVKQRARDVLLKHLETVSGGTNLSWQMFYDPGDKRYGLSILQPVKESH